jgi:hypothetical protein
LTSLVWLIQHNFQFKIFYRLNNWLVWLTSLLHKLRLDRCGEFQVISSLLWLYRNLFQVKAKRLLKWNMLYLLHLGLIDITFIKVKVITTSTSRWISVKFKNLHRFIFKSNDEMSLLSVVKHDYMLNEVNKFWDLVMSDKASCLLYF